MVNLKSLIGKLNDETRAAMDAAAGYCMSLTHYDVELDHYLMKLLDATDGDVAFILKHFGVDRSRLSSDLTAHLDRMKTGSGDRPSLSPKLVSMLQEAWLLGSVDYGARRIRTGHTLLALLVHADLRSRVVASSRELDKIPAEQLRQEFEAVVAKSVEEEQESYTAGGEAGAPAAARPGSGKTQKLDKYTQDLTEQARRGELDPVLGRDFEIRQVVDILTRRRQNNPILVGEAGVGKTAVVEGFAMRVAAGEVPPVLRNVSVRSLDLALLQAGAGVKGEFESRLKGLIDEVKGSATPIILFIDEAHTMIGAGGAAGQNDAANLLKPALARGELRTLAATTWSEYKKYFEKDPALTRRFQVVKIDEPAEDVCKVMLRGVVPSLEKHHKVRILDDGMDAAVRLSARYLSDRQLPDKAVSVLDTACARLALGQASTPPPVENAMRRLQDVDVQMRVLRREETLGIDHAERLDELATRRESIQAELATLQDRWQKERELVEQIRDTRTKLEATVDETAQANGAGATAETTAEGTAEGEGGEPGGAEGAEDAVTAAAEAAPVDAAKLRTDLKRLDAELEVLQGEDPLVPVSVDGELVGQVISGWTGIPVGKMMRDDMAMALELERYLGERVIGQDHAMEVLSHRIRSSKASIEDPGKPIGVFLLVGPSGVGKTETALTLSDLLYGGERNLITIAMSEFQEAHTVSTLKGSPPGYVGYGEGGVLTEAVRRKPYSVVLLDEVEKAHPDVMELFFQVFDKGRMEDGEGREIDFKNTIIILTTNAATDELMALCADPETMPSPAGLVKAIKPELDKVFKPALLGRTVIVPYFPIRDEALKSIIRLKLGKVQRRMEASHRVVLTLSDALVDEIASRCTEVESGARNIDNILTNTLLPDLSTILLRSMVDGTKPGTIHIDLAEDGSFLYNGETRSGSSDAAKAVSAGAS
jgi:type VI secretion system protein VasG